MYNATVRRALLSLCALVLFAGCATTLLEQDIKRQSDGWTVTFHKLADGPNGFTSNDAVQYHPTSGQRFLWVTLSVRNDALRSRQFSFESCAINQGDTAYLPLYVGMNFGYQAQITKTPVLDAGEEITRKLAFGYPEGIPAGAVDLLRQRDPAATKVRRDHSSSFSRASVGTWKMQRGTDGEPIGDLVGDEVTVAGVGRREVAPDGEPAALRAPPMLYVVRAAPDGLLGILRRKRPG